MAMVLVGTGVAVAMPAVAGAARVTCDLHAGYTLHLDAQTRVYERAASKRQARPKRFACHRGRHDRVRVSRRPTTWVSSGGFIVGVERVEDRENHSYSYGRLWRYDTIDSQRGGSIAVGSRPVPTFFTDPVVSPNGTVAWMQFADASASPGNEVHVAEFDGDDSIVDSGDDINLGSLAMPGGPSGLRGAPGIRLYWTKGETTQVRIVP
jgi:hypothetical protein